MFKDKNMPENKSFSGKDANIVEIRSSGTKRTLTLNGRKIKRLLGYSIENNSDGYTVLTLRIDVQEVNAKTGAYGVYPQL